MVRMIKPIERGVRRGRGLKRSQSTMISKRRDTSQSKEMAKELASKPEEANKSGDPHESFMAKAQDSFLAKHLTPDLATSDKLISHKMDICHKAQLTECQVCGHHVFPLINEKFTLIITIIPRSCVSYMRRCHSWMYRCHIVRQGLHTPCLARIGKGQ